MSLSAHPSGLPAWKSDGEPEWGRTPPIGLDTGMAASLHSHAEMNRTPLYRASGGVSGGQTSPAKKLEATSVPIAVRVAQGLHKIGMALKSRRWRQTAKHRLSVLQAEILGLLYREPRQTARISTLAERLAVRIPTVSDAVNTLGRKGLVAKTRGKDDGRAREIALTAPGRRQAAREADWPGLLTQAATQLPLPEQETLLTLVIKLIRLLQTRGDIPVARMCVTCRYFRPHVYDDSVNPHHCVLVDEPFGPSLLRIDCAEHELASQRLAARNWQVFLGGKDAMNFQ